MKKENIWKVVLILIFVFGLAFLYFRQEYKKQAPSYSNSSKQQSQVTKKPSPLQWRVTQYVDNFGDPTRTKYLTFEERVKGTFSNSATTNSKLDVIFLIDNAYSIDIQLFHYGLNHPEKYYWNTVYYIFIKYGDNIQKRLKSVGYKGSDRLSLTDTSSKILHDVLMQGGKIKFSIVNSEDQNNTYNFVINDASGYKEAYYKLRN